jgi:hypothetical protein
MNRMITKMGSLVRWYAVNRILFVSMIAMTITLTLSLTGIGTHIHAEVWESCPDGYHFNDVYNVCVPN